MTHFFSIHEVYYMHTPEGCISVSRVPGHQAGPINVPPVCQVGNHLHHPIDFWRTLDGFKEITGEKFYSIFSLAMNQFTGVAGKYLTRKV
jgi:hypothetical protein